MTRLKPGPTVARRTASARRRSIAAAIVFSGLLLIALGFIIPSLSSKGDMKTTEDHLADAPMIPSIDAAAPAEFETATFALG